MDPKTPVTVVRHILSPALDKCAHLVELNIWLKL